MLRFWCARSSSFAAMLDGADGSPATGRAVRRSGAWAGVLFQNATLMRPSGSCSTCAG